MSPMVHKIPQSMRNKQLSKRVIAQNAIMVIQPQDEFILENTKKKNKKNK
jgi:hypothetical protein